MFVKRYSKWNQKRVLVLLILTASTVEAPPFNIQRQHDVHKLPGNSPDVPTTTTDPVQTVCATEGQLVELPCNITAQPQDAVKGIMWFKDAVGLLYSVDSRSGVSVLQGVHRVRDDLDKKLKIDITKNLTEARLQISNINPADCGMYRCQVDFFNSPTRNYTMNLKLPPPEDSTDTSPYEMQNRNHVDYLWKNRTTKATTAKTTTTTTTDSDSEALRGNDNANSMHQWETPTSEQASETEQDLIALAGIGCSFLLLSVSVYLRYRLRGPDPAERAQIPDPENPADPARPAEIVETEDPANTAEIVETKDPAKTAEIVETEDPAKTGEIVETEDPVKTAEIVETEDPAKTGEIVETEDPAKTGEIVETEDPTKTGEIVETEDPTKTGEKVETEDPAKTGEIVETEDPAKTAEIAGPAETRTVTTKL